MNRLLSFRLFCFALLSVFILSACDSGGSSSDSIDNEFTLTITPQPSSATGSTPKASKKDLNGYSFFVDTDDVDEVDEEAFVIYLNGNKKFSQNNATQGLFGFFAKDGNQPGTGSHPITNESPSSSEFVGWLYEELDNRQSGAPYYFFHDGSLSLSTSTDSKVAGSISGKATQYTFSSSGVSLDTVDVSGSFTAKRLNTYVPYSNYTNP